VGGGGLMQIGGLVVDVDKPAHPFGRTNGPSPLLVGTHERHKFVSRSCIQEMIFSTTIEGAAGTLDK